MLFSRYLLVKYENLKNTTLGNSFRKYGQSMLKSSFKLQGEYYNKDILVPSTRCIPYNDKFPKLLESEFIAPNCSIIGDVTTGKLSSLYFGVNLIGTNCTINIGNKTTILDNTTISNTHTNKHKTINIGNHVSIGTNCYLDACTVEDHCVIGNGASIHPNSIVQSGAMVGAGAVVPPNTTIPSNQIWVGNPAVYLRDITNEEKENLAENKSEQRELSNVLVEETEKSQQEIISDQHYLQDKANINLEDMNKLMKNMISFSMDSNKDEFLVEASTEGYEDLLKTGIPTTIYDMFKEESMENKFMHDMKNYPDYLKVYNENFEKYDRINKDVDNESLFEAGDVFYQDKYNIKPKRPGAMRAWVSKWDPDFNSSFRSVGSKIDVENL